MAESVSSFSELGLPAPILAVLTELGYEAPTPVQERTLPPLLLGKDVLAKAPTGTGKTAAFALPILTRISADVSSDAGRADAKKVKTLVLTPTRELAIQVAEAFARYARGLPGVNVLAIYGGQEYAGQLRALSRGVQVVVGTPGRVTDHLKRGTLKLDGLQTLVLDEADEMLRMGFVDDVEWILDQTPPTRQMALFSATMPPQIQRIARKHLKDAQEVGIEGSRTPTASIRQRVWTVGGLHKLDALTRILEVEPIDAMLVFVRTKSLTVELAEKLSARGFAASPMNGDMPQKERERQVIKLRNGSFDILVATDVAARGLDVARISHVVNYDVPGDTEAYVHRIGRTGRAGRSGDAILFLAARERRLLGALERATGQRIEPMDLPTVNEVNARRVARFTQSIDAVIDSGNLGVFEHIVEEHAKERNLPVSAVAAALAKLALGEKALLLEEPAAGKKARRKRGDDRPAPPEHSRSTTAPAASQSRPPRSAAAVPERQRAAPVPERQSAAPVSDCHSDNAQAEPRQKPTVDVSAGERPPRKRSESRDEAPAKAPVKKSGKAVEGIAMERFRVEVGSEHGLAADNLVGAIANEANIESQYIGRVDIRADHSVIELPEGMPKFMLKELKRVWVCGQKLSMVRENDSSTRGSDASVRETPRVAPKTASSEVKDASSKPKVKGKSSHKKPGKAHRKGDKT